MVTGSDSGSYGGTDHISEAHEHAVALGLPCSELVMGLSNGYASFLIAPDGSKEGWDTSTEQENKRAQWITWARDKHINWACVSFGGDDPELALLEDHDGKENK